MALFKNPDYLMQTNDIVFDKVYHPGAVPDRSGVFRCMGCQREVVGEHSRQLPPQNHHQHTPAQGDVRWKMVVYADHNPK